MELLNKAHEVKRKYQKLRKVKRSFYELDSILDEVAAEIKDEVDRFIVSVLENGDVDWDSEERESYDTGGKIKLIAQLSDKLWDVRHAKIKGAPSVANFVNYMVSIANLSINTRVIKSVTTYSFISEMWMNIYESESMDIYDSESDDDVKKPKSKMGAKKVKKKVADSNSSEEELLS